MDALQLTVTQFCEPAFDGMVADTIGHSGSNTESLLAEGAIPVARAVVTGSDYDRCKLPSSAADISSHFRGFARYEAMKTPPAGYADKDAVGVFRLGRIWIEVEGDVITDGPVYIVNSTGAGTPGRIRGDANSGAATLLPGAIVRKGASAGSKAIIEILSAH